MPIPHVIALSARDGLGIDQWLEWLILNRVNALAPVMA